MRTRKTLTREEWATLIFGSVLTFGLILRLFPGLWSGFPINDGGMWYAMIRDLRANQFILPAFTTYNNLQIPFAYPPLGFYVAGLFGLLGISELTILHWIPILVSIALIFVYRRFAISLLGDRARAAAATLFFALIPGNYDWQIMGGGLTRSLGILLFVLAIHSVYLLFKNGNWKSVLRAGLFCSLAVLSHPEISLATAVSGALVWLFYGRTWRKTFHALLVALTTLALTAPWWGSVLAYHGTAPFLSVVQTGAYTESKLSSLFAAFLAPAALFSVYGLLRVTGVIWGLAQRRFFLVAWALLPYFTEPRSAGGISYLPSSLLIALAVTEALPALYDLIQRKMGRAVSPRDFTQRGWLTFGLFGVLIYFFIAGVLLDFSLANTSLKPPLPQEAMEWVKQNTPADSQFFILTRNSGIMTDPIQEWFPALAERRSQTTMQGLEWTLGPQFFPRLNAMILLQKCDDVACVENWSAENGLGYTYVMIEKNKQTKNLLASFSADEKYSLVFENSKYSIFEK